MTKRIIQMIGSIGFAIAAIAATQVVSATAVAASDMYGAIATNEDGAWGYTYNYPSQAQAESAALSECGKSDCILRVTFKNACGAVAESNSHLGWGWGEDRAEAEAQAISGCGRGDCKVLTWACTDR